MSENSPCNSRAKTLSKTCIYLWAHIFSLVFASPSKVSTLQNFVFSFLQLSLSLFSRKYLFIETIYEIVDCQCRNASVRLSRSIPSFTERETETQRMQNDDVQPFCGNLIISQEVEEMLISYESTIHSVRTAIIVIDIKIFHNQSRCGSSQIRDLCDFKI